MKKCGYCNFPDAWDPDPDDEFWACEADATHTCCDYGGFVCEAHKCRCSKPLKPSAPGKTIYERLLEQ